MRNAEDREGPRENRLREERAAVRKTEVGQSPGQVPPVASTFIFLSSKLNFFYLIFLF